MLITAPSVLYGIFRYLYLIYDRADTRSTAAILGCRWRTAAATPQPWRPCTVPLKVGIRSSYHEDVHALQPTVLWRLRHPQGQHARAVLLPGEPTLTLTFFVDDVMDRAENFDGMDIALFRADEIKRSLVGEGWSEQN